jgi:hypothetical protein
MPGGIAPTDDAAFAMICSEQTVAGCHSEAGP